MTAGTREKVWLAVALTLLSLVLFNLMGLVIKLLSPRYGAASACLPAGLVNVDNIGHKPVVNRLDS